MPDPLAELPRVVAQLHAAVRQPTLTPGSRARGNGLPISTSAYDLLWCSDHRGHPGIVLGLTAMERAVRRWSTDGGQG